jgi:hypothetical protein
MIKPAAGYRPLAYSSPEAVQTTGTIALGVKLDPEIIRKIGAYRADVAVYHEDRPTAIVELKIFDDQKSAGAIIDDRDKIRKLSGLCGVEGYLGVLITDTASGATCEERARALGMVLEQEFDVVGDKQISRTGAWYWCFASGRVRI